MQLFSVHGTVFGVEYDLLPREREREREFVD
jgi:hypothetical protein